MCPTGGSRCVRKKLAFDMSLKLQFISKARTHGSFEFLILNLVTKPVHLVMETYCFEIGVLWLRHVRCWQDHIVVKVCVLVCGMLPPCNFTLQYNPTVSLLGIRTQTCFSFFLAAWSIDRYGSHILLMTVDWDEEESFHVKLTFGVWSL